MSSFRKPITVLRTAPGHYDDAGIWVPGEPATTTVPMSVQPLRAKEMDALPEGRRGSRAVKVYAGAALLVADQTTGQNADIITWQGSSWEVVSCDPYQMDVIPHYKALAVEVKAN
jgi:hypothetical protein